MLAKAASKIAVLWPLLHTLAVSLCKMRIFYGLSEFRTSYLLHKCKCSICWIYSAGMCLGFIYSLVGAQLCGLWLMKFWVRLNLWQYSVHMIRVNWANCKQITLLTQQMTRGGRGPLRCGDQCFPVSSTVCSVVFICLQLPKWQSRSLPQSSWLRSQRPTRRARPPLTTRLPHRRAYRRSRSWTKMTRACAGTRRRCSAELVWLQVSDQCLETPETAEMLFLSLVTACVLCTPWWTLVMIEVVN